MYLRRAGLACVLILLTACFILSHAVPAKQGGRPSSTDSSVTKSKQNPPTGKDDGPTKDVSTTEPPTDLSTPQVTSLKDKDKDETTTTTAAPSVSPSEPSDSKATKEHLEFLYFQIRRCISKRNLTLDDIQDVLSQKDDENQFMYTLAYKLGYIVDSNHDDPHIPVIMTHRKKLITLLEEAAAKLSKPPSQEDKEELAESYPGDEQHAADNEPTTDSKRIGYEVNNAIRKLGSDAIYALLSDPSFADSLGYTVGVELGYSPVDVHMKYLENTNPAELKTILQGTLELKTSASKKILDASPDDRNEATPTRGEEPNSNGGQTQEEGGDTGSNRGGASDVQPPQLQTGSSAGTDNPPGGFVGAKTVDENQQNLSHKHNPGGNSQMADPSPSTAKGDVDGKNHAEQAPTGTGGRRGGEGGEPSQQPTGNGGENQGGTEVPKKANAKPSLPDGGEEVGSENGSHMEGHRKYFPDDDDDDGNGDENSNSDNGTVNGNDGENRNDNDNDGGDVNLNHFSGTDELNQQRMRLVQNKDFQSYLASNDPRLYYQLVDDQADQDDIDEALEKWKQESDGNKEEDEKKEGVGKDTEPEAKEGETVGKVDMHALYLSYYYPCCYICILYNHVFIPELAWRALSLSLSLPSLPSLPVSLCVFVCVPVCTSVCS